MTYWRLFYHLTWGTKGRLPLIETGWMPNLHNVIAAKARELGAFVYAVGGTQDHVHLVASIPPGISLSQFVGQVKGTSSHWVNHDMAPDGHFAWQEEYGVLSFGGKQLDFVVEYVKSQAQHHDQGTVIALMERIDPGANPAISAGANNNVRKEVVA